MESRLAVGSRVKYSASALRSKREAVGTYGGARGDQLKRWYEEAKAKRGTILELDYAQADHAYTLTRKGDFIGYSVQFDGETGVHHTMPHMVEAAEGGRA